MRRNEETKRKRRRETAKLKFGGFFIFYFFYRLRERILKGKIERILFNFDFYDIKVYT